MDTSGFQYLKSSLPKSACLKSDPTIVCFDCSKGKTTWTVKVLNHTSLKLEIGKDGSFYVNDYQGINSFPDFCHLIFYGLKGYPELLCLEKQDACFFKTRSFADLKESDIALTLDLQGTIHELSEKIYKKILVLLATKDATSCFYENTLPIDVTHQIVLSYERLCLSPN